MNGTTTTASTAQQQAHSYHREYPNLAPCRVVLSSQPQRRPSSHPVGSGSSSSSSSSSLPVVVRLPDDVVQHVAMIQRASHTLPPPYDFEVERKVVQQQSSSSLLWLAERRCKSALAAATPTSTATTTTAATTAAHATQRTTVTEAAAAAHYSDDDDDDDDHDHDHNENLQRLVTQMKQVTQEADDSICISILEGNSYDLNTSIEAYFMNSPKSAAAMSNQSRQG